MNMQNKNKRPEMTNAGIAASYPVSVTDEFGKTRKTHITGERPLTIYIDKQEIVTLMTLGKFPELLVMGYLHNQGFIKTVAEIKAVQVDWDIESATVVTTNGSDNWDEKLKKRTVTSGCGQGTVFGNIMEDLENINLTSARMAEIGLPGYTNPIKGTCDDHANNGPIFIQQWNGSSWERVSGWINSMDRVRPMLEKAAADYKAKNNIPNTTIPCS